MGRGFSVAAELPLLACAFSLQLLAAVVTGSDVTVSPAPSEDTTPAVLTAENSSFLTGSQTPEGQTGPHMPHHKDFLNISSLLNSSIWPTPGGPQAPTGAVWVRSVEVQPHGEEQDSGAQIGEVDWEQRTNSNHSASEALGSRLTSPLLAKGSVQELMGCPDCQRPERISEAEPLTLASPSNSLDVLKGAEGSGETFGLMRGTTTLKEKQDARLVRFEEATNLPAQGTEGSTDYTRVDLEMQLWSERSTISAHHPLSTSEPSTLPADYIYDSDSDTTLDSSDKFPIVEAPDVPMTSSNIDSTKDFLPDLPALTSPPDHSVSGVQMATLYYWDEMASELESEDELRLTTVSPKIQTILVKEEDITRQTVSSPDFISESYLTVFTDTSDSETRQDISLSPLVLGEGKKECKLGYLKQNKSCKSICDMAPNYCYNGGQCFVMENIGAICRCNAQDYIWHKGIRCEFIVTEFQVMCIAIGSSAAVILLLFMLTVFFAKKVYSLKTENKKLRKRSKYRPQLEQHNDNFSLSTIAEGSQANDDVNGQNKIHESLKTCPKDEDSFNVQNNWTPKHDNKESASAEVNSLQNNMM
ncbi:chondroitin sulfate proteoglycan 5-like [Pristis pectinata]|uniref:chondroitin sulfate proteoglycan 5-like n=1 Tax=Pristis pectinata TaxID=685728 RepID=UPI00223DCADC|nr:chondroitin sulfate proteoglycan 5-like [Pristis pectinata]